MIMHARAASASLFHRFHRSARKKMRESEERARNLSRCSQLLSGVERASLIDAGKVIHSSFNYKLSISIPKAQHSARSTICTLFLIIFCVRCWVNWGVFTPPIVGGRAPLLIAKGRSPEVFIRPHTYRFLYYFYIYDIYHYPMCWNLLINNLFCIKKIQSLLLIPMGKRWQRVECLSRSNIYILSSSWHDSILVCQKNKWNADIVCSETFL